MRLNMHNGGPSRIAAGNPELERIETLLHQAADFEPVMQPAEDFIRIALQGKRRRESRVRPLVMGFGSLASGVAAAAVVMFLMSHNGMGGVEVAPMQPDGVAENGGANPDIGSSSPTNTVQSRPPNERGEMTSPVRPDPTVVRKDPPATRTRSSSEPDNALRGPRLVNASDNRESRPSLPAPGTVPKVRWKTETVQSYDRGVIEPAYMVEEKTPDGDVVYQPVMMPVTTETGARPLLVNGMPDTSIQLTSLSEETAHK